MKRVVKDKELRNYMNDAINLLCDTVKSTLGPKGCNAIIDHSLFSPFITNDGVTIAENIESDDEIINTILELTKSSSIKTNDVVGDGTTSTLVILQSIYNEGTKYIESGVNPIILKNKVMNTLENIVIDIKKLSRNTNKNDLYNVAYNSSGSSEIANNLLDAYKKVKDFKSIKIIESSNDNTYLKYYKGYYFELDIPNNYYFKNKMVKDYNNVYSILINGYVSDINNISLAINEIISKNGTLLIISENFDDYFVSQILSLNNEYNINIILLKVCEYGSNISTLFKDLEVICNAKLVSNDKELCLEDIGFIENLTLDNGNVIINYNDSEIIKEYRKMILLDKDYTFDKDFFNKRISMFNDGICEIRVGGLTQVETREKKMKYDDALCALKSCENGVLPGCGISLLEVSNNINSSEEGYSIFKNALTSVFNQIMINAGIEYESVKNEIVKYSYKKIYNVILDKYEDINNTTVIDSTDVVINSLMNATSVACMLLTTTSLIINEHINSTLNESM